MIEYTDQQISHFKKSPFQDVFDDMIQYSDRIFLQIKNFLPDALSLNNESKLTFILRSPQLKILTANKGEAYIIIFQ